MKIDDAVNRLVAVGNDPDALAMVTLELVLGSTTPELGEAFKSAAIPHWFEADILSNIMEVDQKKATWAVRELSGLSMVEEFPARNGQMCSRTYEWRA